MKHEPINPSTLLAVVVNPDHIQLNALSELVRKAGLEPHAFTTVEDALANMSASTRTTLGNSGALPAIVVTDLYMPGIDGWRFCRLLRSPEYAAFNRVPILVVSATFAGEDPDRIAGDLGAEAFLPSPVDDKRFAEQVQAIMEGRQLHPRPRVLIAEDNEALANLIKKAFDANGYEADMALTAKSATENFKATKYAVAVLDNYLPDGKGETLLDTFRVKQPDCVCIMMTADPGPELALNWMQRGAVAYLHKPFEMAYLIELCARARRERALLRVQDTLELRTRELRESEEELRGLFKGMLNAFALFESVFDSEGKFISYRFVYINDAYERITGVKNETVKGKTIHEVWPRTEQEWIDKYGEVAVTGVSKTFDMLHHPTNKLYHCNVYRPWNTKDRFCVIFDDITERKRIEDEKAKLEVQFQQVRKMESVGRLAGGMAHDFNNMLGVILGHVDMAIESVDPTQPIFDNLQQIRKAAERSVNLTRQLLAFARKQTIEPKVLDLNETVTGMLNMLHRLIGEEIHLIWNPGANLWPIMIDPSQIDQILANLCINARDAIAGIGTVVIETETIVFEKEFYTEYPGFIPGEYVLLSVSDDGCGMDKEILAHIFEPFFTTKIVGEGTGLGLATVYGIVNQNNGFVNVHSQPGQGTTFNIYFPRHVGNVAQMQKEEPADTATHGHETILLVEDEPAILKITTVILKRLGYTTLAAATPAEAIRIAEEHTGGDIHLLITDVVMPEMSGRDLARRLTSLFPGIKCLFMSGYTADIISHHGVLDEGISFIQKPFSAKDLAPKVRGVLSSEGGKIS